MIVPNRLHHEVATAVLASGKHLLVEEQIAAMVATVREGRPPPCTGQDGKWSVAVRLATQMSVQTDRRVAMSSRRRIGRDHGHHGLVWAYQVAPDLGRGLLSEEEDAAEDEEAGEEVGSRGWDSEVQTAGEAVFA